ncbi:hypothetical protein BY458DRAFT_505880 [Sporodiniella umbellata]|nr:hypothetical protein BY458DRAFT_505880 [Sporodiniella umbellata]
MPQDTMQNWSHNTNINTPYPKHPYSSQQDQTHSNSQEAKSDSQNTNANVPPPMTQAIPTAGIIVEVNHITYNRTFYFQLSPEATIEPLIGWLRITFQDPTISGMVLQYKGFDGLWKCLLNRKLVFGG